MALNGMLTLPQNSVCVVNINVYLKQNT